MLVESVPTSLEELRPQMAAGKLYAVADACDTPSVPTRADEVGEGRAVSLYSGSAQEEYWSIAPYLFRVDDEILEWIRGELWEEPWGIFAITDADFETVRRHFKKFLVVGAPTGEQWYFRYYDPRVLSAFLPTCDAAQLAEIFGPVRGFIASERGGKGSLIRLREDVSRPPLTPPAPDLAPVPRPSQEKGPPRQIRIPL